MYYKSDAIITFSLNLQWSFLTNPLMFHTPHLTLPSVGEDRLAGLRAVALGPRSAIAVASGAVGMSGAVMLGEVGDLAQSVGGENVCVDGKRWAHDGGQWRIEGSGNGGEIDGVALVLGDLSISLIFPALVFCPKKDLGVRVGWR